MKKILITGALGQDGIILSKVFLKNGYKVYGFITNNSKKFSKKINYTNIRKKNFTFIQYHLDTIKPDIIIHLGSHNPSFKKKFVKRDYNLNLNLSLKIFNYAKDNNVKIIFPSSSQIFLESKKRLNENSKIKVENYYTKFRIKASDYLLKLKKQFKLKATIVILFNHDSKYRNKRFLFPRLIKAIKEKKFKLIKKIFTNNIAGDFSHAEDICNAIFLLVKKNKNPDKIILSSGKITYINDIIKYFLPNMENIVLKIPKKNYKLKIGNNTKILKILNWKIKKNSLDAAKEILKSV